MQTPTTLDRDPTLTIEAFRSAVGESVVDLEVRAVDPASFRGAIDARSSGDLHVLSITTDAHAVHRTESLIRSSTHHFVKFTLCEHGSGLIVQDGRETTLRPGDMAFYDTDRPYSLISEDDSRISVVMFPRERVALPGEVMSRLTATRLGERTALPSVVRPYVSALSGQLDSVSAHTLRRLGNGAIEMISALIESDADRLGAPVGDSMLQRVIEYIDEHLGSPELSPPMIAAAHYISVRHLHTLVSAQGTTVSTLIRNRRLERCYEQLVDPRMKDTPVMTIAHAHGFSYAAHFSRTFRAHYGVPPSAVRP